MKIIGESADGHMTISIAEYTKTAQRPVTGQDKVHDFKQR
jgi:hypothetical protein